MVRRMDDRVYLEQRAEAELSLAQAAEHPAVVRAHYLLAGFYLDRLYDPEREEYVRPGENGRAGPDRQ
jgi:hypothetical protein